MRSVSTDDCWLWARNVNPEDYGTINYGGKGYSAHRFVYQCLVGDIPKGMQCDHLCKIPRCVNPDHIDIVTHMENMQRKFGGSEDNPLCKEGHKLTEDNIYWFVRNRITGRVSRRCKTCHSVKHAIWYRNSLKLKAEGTKSND